MSSSQINPEYIQIKKLANHENDEFYPLTVAKAVLTSEDIVVKNILGREFYTPGNPATSKVPFGNDLHGLLERILGAEFGAASMADIDTSVTGLTDNDDHVPSSKLLRMLLLTMLGGNLNLKFKVLTYEAYQILVANNEVDDNTLYFTIGGAPIQEYWTVTFNANGGSVSETTRYVVKGQPYGTLPIPSYPGHTFHGWYINSNENLLATEISLDDVVTEVERNGVIVSESSGKTYISATDIPTSNVTVYADWVEDSEEDLLCLEEDHNTLIITEDGQYNINLGESTEPILATEVDHTPVITEDGQYNISLKDSTDPILATEIQHDPVVTEDGLNNISLKQSTEPLLATEIQKDLVKTEDKQNNISLRQSSDPLLSTEIDKDLVKTEDKENNINLRQMVSSSQTVMAAAPNTSKMMMATFPMVEDKTSETVAEEKPKKTRKSRKRKETTK